MARSRYSSIFHQEKRDTGIPSPLPIYQGAPKSAGCKVHAYALAPQTRLNFPRGTRLLGVGYEGTVLQLWALVPVEPTGELEPRDIVVVRSCDALPHGSERYTFLGTAVWQEQVVAHVFEVV